MIARPSGEFEGLLVTTDHWPILLMEFPEEQISDAALHQTLHFIEGLLGAAKEAGERTYQITDLSRMQRLPPASHRKYAADWVGRTLAIHREVSLGGVNVTPSALLRGIVILINWWQESDRPTTFVATRDEAFILAVRAFDEAQIRLRPDLRARLAPTVRTH